MPRPTTEFWGLLRCSRWGWPLSTVRCAPGGDNSGIGRRRSPALICGEPPQSQRGTICFQTCSAFVVHAKYTPENTPPPPARRRWSESFSSAEAAQRAFWTVGCAERTSLTIKQGKTVTHVHSVSRPGRSLPRSGHSGQADLHSGRKGPKTPVKTVLLCPLCISGLGRAGLQPHDVAPKWY